MFRDCSLWVQEVCLSVSLLPLSILFWTGVLTFGMKIWLRLLSSCTYLCLCFSVIPARMLSVLSSLQAVSEITIHILSKRILGMHYQVSLCNEQIWKCTIPISEHDYSNALSLEKRPGPTRPLFWWSLSSLRDCRSGTIMHRNNIKWEPWIC